MPGPVTTFILISVAAVALLLGLAILAARRERDEGEPDEHGAHPGTGS